MSRQPQCVQKHKSSFPICRANAAMLGAALLFSAAIASQAAAQETEYAYVASASGNEIDGYQIDSTSGALAPLKGPAVSAGQSGASAIAIDSRGGFVYVAKGNDADNDVAGFRIDGPSGKLSPVPGSPFHADSHPSALVVDPSGSFVYVANAGSNDISGFRIESNTGRLVPLAGSPFSAGNSPDALAISPTGKYLFAANGSDDNISAYTLDATSGALTQVPGSPFATGTDPLTLAIDPIGLYLYAGAGDANVYSYQIDQSTGALTNLAGSPVKAGDGSVNGVTVDPTDKFVYAAGAGGVYTYSIRQSSSCFPCVSPGSLSLVSVTPPGTGTTPGASEWTPISFVQDYTGRFGYAPDGATANTVTGFTVAAGGGTLTTIAGSPFSAPGGAGPMAITRPPSRSLFSAELVPLTTFQPVKSATASGINNLGHVDGTVAEAGPEVLDFTFLYANGSTTGGGGFGTHTSFAYGLNDEDQVVGTSATSVPVAPFLVLSEAYLFSGGSTINIDGRAGGESSAYAINNGGIVTGSWSTGTCQIQFGGCLSSAGLGDTHAFLYNGQMNDLGTLGGNFSEGKGINDSGVVVGGSNTVTGGPNHLFSYQSGTMTDLGMLKGQSTEGTAINNKGEIIGTGAAGFVFRNGHYHQLPLLPGGTYMLPQGIDDLGAIVGTCDVAGGGPTHACGYFRGQSFDLNQFVDPGLNLLTAADGINNKGQIVAQGLDGQVYVLTPAVGQGGLNSAVSNNQDDKAR